MRRRLIVRKDEAEVRKRINEVLSGHVFEHMSQDEIEFEINRDIVEVLQGYGNR